MLYDVTRFENNNYRKYSAIRGVDFSIHIPLLVTEVLSNSIQGITTLEWAGERLSRNWNWGQIFILDNGYHFSKKNESIVGGLDVRRNRK